MPLHCTPYEQQRYPLNQLQFWIDQQSNTNELPLQFPGVHPPSRVVEHREGLVFKDVIPDAKLPPLCLRHAPFGKPMFAQPLAPPWFYRVIQHTTMILRGLEITDPNAQVEKGMATSFPPLWWFRTKDKPPPGALDPILPLDVARIIVSYLMDIHVLVVHFEDRVLYMIRLEEFVRLCHHYYTGETIPQAKLYLVTSTFVDGVLTYGPLQYYGTSVQPHRFLAEFDEWVKHSHREKKGGATNQPGKEIARRAQNKHCRLLQEMVHIERDTDGEPLLPPGSASHVTLDTETRVVLSPRPRGAYFVRNTVIWFSVYLQSFHYLPTYRDIIYPPTSVMTLHRISVWVIPLIVVPCHNDLCFFEARTTVSLMATVFRH